MALDAVSLQVGAVGVDLPHTGQKADGPEVLVDLVELVFQIVLELDDLPMGLGPEGILGEGVVVGRLQADKDSKQDAEGDNAALDQHCPGMLSALRND